MRGSADQKTWEGASGRTASDGSRTTSPRAANTARPASPAGRGQSDSARWTARTVASSQPCAASSSQALRAMSPCRSWADSSIRDVSRYTLAQGPGRS
ncbi:hypothetical protein [Streptomyces sp. MRC013]|uniref:hypothetical protein n=1 Tax=Streptomyces sp. MRC013 TaxID=2898276 RepID=UPI0032EA44F3